jgi:hypothetical protein
MIRAEMFEEMASLCNDPFWTSLAGTRVADTWDSHLNLTASLPLRNSLEELLTAQQCKLDYSRFRISHRMEAHWNRRTDGHLLQLGLVVADVTHQMTRLDEKKPG